MDVSGQGVTSQVSRLIPPKMAAANFPERTNWYQCIRLLMEGGRTVLKEFIKKSYIPTPGSLDLFLNLQQNKDSLSSLHKRKILNKDQWDKLFPSADLENMDITLLSYIICYCIAKPRSEERRAVDDLRELRNSFHGHAFADSMNKDEFERNWKKITTVLSKAQHDLDVNISLNELITKIENEKLLNNDLVCDELEAWERFNALMRDMKVQIKESSDVKDRVSNIEKQFEDEKKLTIDEKESKLPAEILLKGSRAIQIFKKALSDGKHAVQNIRVMLVGQSGVGKTTLLKRLLGQDVDIKKNESTEGIEVHVHRCKIEVESGQWHCEDEVRPHPNNALLSAIWPQLTGTQEESSLQQVQDTSPRSDTSPITDDEVIYRRQQNVTGIDGSIASEPESKKSDVHASTVRLQSSSSKSDDTKVEQQFKELMETYKNYENLLDSNFANVSFWDFAGQYIFYNTHQVFLSHRTVYLLVTNLLHILDEAGPQGQDCDTKLHDTIDFWVNSIHFFCGKEKHNPSVPPVILVATHCDKIDQAQKEILIHSHFQKVRDIFANKITAGHIVDEMEFAVDNSVEDREFEELKKAIFDVAKTQYYWQEEHPVRWLTLEKELFVKGNSGEKVLQHEAVKDINRMLPYPLKDPELDLFLQFQSDLGNILYISEGQLKDYVLLNPQWVADAFKCIITAEHFLNRKMMLREHWKQAKKTGKINTEIIEAVWRNEESEGFYKEREFLLLLMQQLNLIARPIGTEQPPSHYFVPCLITERPRCLPIPFKGEATSSVLTLSAESRFFPLILFHKLIASCIQKYQIHNNCIYDNSALFADDVHVFTVLYVDNTVKVWVKNLAKAIPDSKVCHSVLKFLIECIRQLLQLSCSKTPSVAIFICCPEVEVYSVQGMHQLPNDIDLWQAQSKKNVLCSNESCEPHSISMGDALKHWIQGPKNSEDQTYKKALDKAWARLVEEMDSGELLDKFMEKELLSPVAIRDLREEKITSQRNRTVLEKVRTLGPKKYEVYKECLTMIKQEHLAKLLHDYEREITAQD